MANEQALYDAVIVGGGPAGLTAALYLARARYRVIVVEQDHFGGQITITSEIVNYPGVPSSSGKELAESMRSQAEAFGAEFLLAEAVGVDLEGDVKTVRTTRGDLQCFAVLLATGAHPRRVGFAGEDAFQGRGVAYCATCDGEFFQDKEVFVVGGGYAAAEESVFLTKYATHVTILMVTDDFTCASSVADEARAHDKITVLPHTQLEEVSGDDAVRCVRYRDTATGEVTKRCASEGDSFGVFVFAGYEPATELVREAAEVDEFGYIVTDRSQRTSVEGLYAAGDVCVKALRQVVTATGEAALAATEMERYVAAMQERTGLVPVRPDRATARAANLPVAANASQEGGGLFDQAARAQLDAVFGRMESSLVLRLSLGEGAASEELRSYMEELARLTDKLSVEVSEDAGEEAEAPCVRVHRADGTATGLAFHGVPGGHEFTSFVLGLYNAAGPGQPIDDESREAIAAISRPIDLKVLVSLSCTMCPDTVVAAQRIAAENPHVRADVYDLNHFPDLKERFNVMSVPCVVVNDGERVSFGKKNLGTLLDLVG